MKKILQNIKNSIKKDLSTIKLFIITLIITSPINAFLTMVIVMSNNPSNAYISKDLFALALWSLFIPLLVLVIFVHSISILIIIISKVRKGKKFNLRLYIILVIMHSLPFNIFFFYVHSDKFF